MKKIIFSLLFLLSILINPALAKNSRIELTDGSVVNGNIISYTNGVYAVNSQDMGTILINESKIKNIGFDASSDSQEASSLAPLSGNNQLAGQTEALKNQVMSNPKIMDSIASLKDDPQVQEVLTDPEVAAAIKAGDINALSKNEKFMSLTTNPKIQKLKEETSGGAQN